MSHAVESMFYTGETPWHRLGQRLANAPTIEQAIAQSGLDWTVEHHTLRTAEGLESDHRLVVRDTDRRVLGTVGPRTEILQNRDAFELFRPWVDTGDVALETAGSLHSGKRVWVLGRLQPRNADSERVSADDRINRYVLLGHGHDGSLSIRFGLTGVRVVCANTMAMALSKRAGGLITIRHTKSMATNLEDARQAITDAHGKADQIMQRFRALRDVPVRKRSAVDAYLAAVFGPTEAKKQAEAATKGARSELATAVETLMIQGRGTDLPGVKGTAWGLYNAVSEYLTHVHGRGKNERRKAERRADRNVWGDGAKVLSRAMSDEVIAVLQERAGESAVTRGVPLSAVGL